MCGKSLEKGPYVLTMYLNFFIIQICGERDPWLSGRRWLRSRGCCCNHAGERHYMVKEGCSFFVLQNRSDDQDIRMVGA